MTFIEKLLESLAQNRVEVFHVTPSKNVDSILKTGFEPRIGELSKKAGEKIPAVYFYSTRHQAEDSARTWIAQTQDKPEPLTILRADVNCDDLTHKVGYEHYTTKSVPADSISVVGHHDVTQTKPR